MIKGTTTSGFEYEISEERLENYEVVEALVELEENPIVLPKVVNLILGKEQANKLKEYLRDSEGLVSTRKMMGEIKDIFQRQPIKNSYSSPEW